MSYGSTGTSFSHNNGWKVRSTVQDPRGAYVIDQLKKKIVKGIVK